MYYVYSRCFGGSTKIYLCQDFSGSRYECEKFLRMCNRNGRYTGASFISKLGMDAAKRRYIEGRY